MSDKLDLILDQLKELTQMVSAVRHRQEEMDAKLEALTMDSAKIHGEVVAIKENMATKNDLRYYDLKTGELERELFKIKHD
jgi:hypothetical protein